MQVRHLLLSGALLASVACKDAVQKQSEAKPYSDRHDYHSYANPEQIRVKHVALDLTVSFEQRTLSGTSTLTVERTGNQKDAPLVLDSRDLTISKAESSPDGLTFQPVQFQVGSNDPILGAPLTVRVPANVSHVRITYTTSPGATALQWLTPAQTSGKKHPFLYTQSEPIYARTWIPLQDSPGVRATYTAHIRTPKDLLAAMSAKNDHVPKLTGDYSFEMPQAIPSYLIALAVGDLGYHAVSSRAGVYAEPSVLPKAAKEFEDMEKMIRAAEQLYGSYRWDEYDVLILPPSFPYGGMENPRLTFLTPTLLAGDKSLVGVVSHELAHSWSGNLVTNATWRDFWLNEGFTTYFERRIQEVVYGRDRSEMEALIEKRHFLDDLKTMAPKDQILYIDLKGRDPEEGSTQVPYDKGMLFLRQIEELYGRDDFDSFLRGYFDQYAFQSITTGDFLGYIQSHLLNRDPAKQAQIGLTEWLTQPGLPANAPEPKSSALDEATRHAHDWLAGKATLASLPSAKWSTPEWQQFLMSLPQNLDAARMGELDRAFHLTKSGNSEILFQWLMMSIRSKYEPARPELERFLLTVGRRKFIRPLYDELAKTPEGMNWARRVYTKARPGYHPISATTIDAILKVNGK